jgi:hypothetical protein
MSTAFYPDGAFGRVWPYFFPNLMTLHSEAQYMVDTLTTAKLSRETNSFFLLLFLLYLSF